MHSSNCGCGLVLILVFVGRYYLPKHFFDLILFPPNSLPQERNPIASTTDREGGWSCSSMWMSLFLQQHEFSPVFVLDTTVYWTY